MKRKMIRSIALSLLFTSFFTTFFAKKVVAYEPVTYETVEEVSTAAGPYKPIVWIAGVAVVIGTHLYSACKTNQNIVCYLDAPRLPETYEPNGVLEKIDNKTKIVTQRRYYDEQGRAKIDVDYGNHGDPVHHKGFFHKHEWIWKNNKGKRLTPDVFTHEEIEEYVYIPKGMVNKKFVSENPKTSVYEVTRLSGVRDEVGNLVIKNFTYEEFIRELVTQYEFHMEFLDNHKDNLEIYVSFFKANDGATKVRLVEKRGCVTKEYESYSKSMVTQHVFLNNMKLSEMFSDNSKGEMKIFAD